MIENVCVPSKYQKESERKKEKKSIFFTNNQTQ